MSREVCFVAGLLLVGCTTEEVPTTPSDQPPTGFVRPVGVSRNPRVGFIGHNPTATGPQLVQLTRAAMEVALKKDELVVSRNRQLQPTALLRIIEIRGLAAIAVPLRGQPAADEEVVLPGSPLRQAAEALPPSGT